MTRHTLPVLVAVIVCFAIMASPAYAQFEKGDKDVQIFGTLMIPHSNPGGATAFGDFGLGYYPSKRSRVGFDFNGNGGGGSGGFGVNGGYDYFFSSKSPKFSPFVGGQAGVNVQFSSGLSSSFFQTQGEFGVDYYVSKKAALDTRYILQYLPQMTGTAANKTTSMVTMGFRFLF